MRVLVNIAEGDKSYQGFLKGALQGLGLQAKATTKTLAIDELTALAKRIGAEAIYCTNPKTIAKCVPTGRTGKVNQDDWRGSVLHTSIPIVIGNPLHHIRTTLNGKLLFNIDIAKLKATRFGKFEYDYTICHSTHDLQLARRRLQTKDVAMSVIDIETTLDNKISSIAFTNILNDFTIGDTYTICLLPSHWQDIEDAYLAWKIVKELCENSTPKVFHNGTFDCFHLLRFNIIVNNYLYDTEYIWRCWYAELNKSLAKIASYLLPDFYYWKHEADLNPLEYNAKDTINTARIIIQLLQKAPKWVWKNYTQLCPNIAPVIYTNFEGFLVDIEKRNETRKEAQAELDKITQQIAECTGLPSFNPGSWQQVSALLYVVLRAKKPGRAKSDSATGEIELLKVARQHPVYSYIISLILKYRELRKAITTYYDARLDDKNRLYYSLALDGTETARMACNASSLYAPPPPGKNLVKSNVKNLGTQLQNIPYYAKKALKADKGYDLIDTDKSQSEARCTAYLAACEALREALENPPETAGVRDFYCYTGFKFFGIEFNKEDMLRQAVKKIIHGTNYIMGAQTFIDSVGIEELRSYQAIVGFKGVLLKFAEYLLGLYHEAYPEVREGWNKTVQEVATTGKVVTPDGWTRIILGDIVNNHNVMRSAVAHKSQHFSVVGINEAFWKLFYYVQVPSNGEYRLKGQIHDSIISQAKKEKVKYYAAKQEEYMDIPQPTPFGVLKIPLETDISHYWKE